eukprot:TRINITY_DN3497_c0_g3_i12.p1 TRINITY_DN3497_c0_g3~~TRINITY_DN3497_c0_g3_i12.p1  ORF type:complete len:818 (-),score=118.02 TRINITY_DN3497_c0_g3_i12:414-2867(-)
MLPSEIPITVAIIAAVVGFALGIVAKVQLTPSRKPREVERERFFRFTWLVLDVLPCYLRVHFKILWDQKYNQQLKPWSDGADDGQAFWHGVYNSDPATMVEMDEGHYFANRIEADESDGFDRIGAKSKIRVEGNEYKVLSVDTKGRRRLLLNHKAPESGVFPAHDQIVSYEQNCDPRMAKLFGGKVLTGDRELWDTSLLCFALLQSSHGLLQDGRNRLHVENVRNLRNNKLAHIKSCKMDCFDLMRAVETMDAYVMANLPENLCAEWCHASRQVLYEVVSMPPRMPSPGLALQTADQLHQDQSDQHQSDQGHPGRPQDPQSDQDLREQDPEYRPDDSGSQGPPSSGHSQSRSKSSTSRQPSTRDHQQDHQQTLSGAPSRSSKVQFMVDQVPPSINAINTMALQSPPGSAQTQIPTTAAAGSCQAAVGSCQAAACRCRSAGNCQAGTGLAQASTPALLLHGLPTQTQDRYQTQVTRCLDATAAATTNAQAVSAKVVETTQAVEQQSPVSGVAKEPAKVAKAPKQTRPHRLLERSWQSVYGNPRGTPQPDTCFDSSTLIMAPSLALATASIAVAPLTATVASQSIGHAHSQPVSQPTEDGGQYLQPALAGDSVSAMMATRQDVAHMAMAMPSTLNQSANCMLSMSSDMSNQTELAPSSSQIHNGKPMWQQQPTRTVQVPQAHVAIDPDVPVPREPPKSAGQIPEASMTDASQISRDLQSGLQSGQHSLCGKDGCLVLSPVLPTYTAHGQSPDTVQARWLRELATDLEIETAEALDLDGRSLAEQLASELIVPAEAAPLVKPDEEDVPADGTIEEVYNLV